MLWLNGVYAYSYLSNNSELHLWLLMDLWSCTFPWNVFVHCVTLKLCHLWLFKFFSLFLPISQHLSSVNGVLALFLTHRENEMTVD